LSEKEHTIHVRNLKDETYQRLWNLRKFHKATSWAELLDRITEQYVKDIEEYEWL